MVGWGWRPPVFWDNLVHFNAFSGKLFLGRVSALRFVFNSTSPSLSKGEELYRH
jgi:hypothetical protein